jgi:hypothetical protein
MGIVKKITSSFSAKKAEDYNIIKPDVRGDRELQKLDTEESRKKFLIDEIHKMRDLKKSIKSDHIGAAT